MGQLAEKWMSVQMVSDNKAVGAFMDALKVNRELFNGNTGSTPMGGMVTMVRIPEQEGKVFEVVYGSTNDDMLQCVYQDNPIFADRKTLLDARADLIQMIADIKEADPSNLFIECPVRHRPVEMRELSTAALIHILKVITHGRI